MATLPEQTPGDDEFFRLFRILRESTARVSDAFVRKVRISLAKLVDEERLESPSLLDVVGQLSIDSWNILASVTHDDGDDRTPDEEDDHGSGGDD